MRVKKLHSDKEFLINTKKYLIDWDNDGNSSLERQFRDLIRPYWKHSIILFQYTIIGSLLKIDFFNLNKRVAVEVDGKQHSTFNKFFTGGSRANYLQGIKRDLYKEQWCEYNNIKLVRLEKQDLDNFSPENIEKQFGVNII